MNKLTLTASFSLMLLYSVYGQVKIDHVIISTQNLSKSINKFDSLGFIVTNGRQHTNGLVNAFIKFSNGSEIELMALTKAPSDKLSQTYANLLSQRVSGAFLCLTGAAAEIKNKLTASHVLYSWTVGNGWDYITFPDPELAHIFLIFYHNKVNKNSFAEHRNGAVQLAAVLIDGNTKVNKLFAVLFEDSFKNNEVVTLTGKIVLSYGNSEVERPVVKSLVVTTKNSKSVLLDLEE